MDGTDSVSTGRFAGVDLACEGLTAEILRFAQDDNAFVENGKFMGTGKV
jgi:hypothetical protein